MPGRAGMRPPGAPGAAAGPVFAPFRVGAVVLPAPAAAALGAPFPVPLKCAEHPAVGVAVETLHGPPSWYDGSTWETWSKRADAAADSQTKRSSDSGTPRATSESTRPFAIVTVGGSFRETGSSRSTSGCAA